MSALHGVVMDRDELIVNLARAISGDRELLLDGWSHLVLVCVFEDGSPDMSGFCYIPGSKPVPVSPSELSILDLVEELRTAMATHDGKAPWMSCLIRVSRESGEVSVDYEYKNPSRWAITPANVKQRATEFAPAGHA
jgi:hypothetical protein